MSQTLRALMRETGAAVAVLSIYVLTLLVPLHQAAATQRGFAELGYEALGAWTVCITATDTGAESDAGNIAKCPVVGIGKAALSQAASDIAVYPHVTIPAGWIALQDPLAHGSNYRPGHPRAPPLHV